MLTHIASQEKALEIRNAHRNLVGELRDGNAKSGEEGEYILLVDPRALDRECLSRGLSVYNPAIQIVAAGSIEEWRQLHLDDPSVVLVVFNGKTAGDADTIEEIRNVVDIFDPHPVVVIADSDDIGEILKVVEAGAKGYIPTSVNINVAAEATALARAGGVFIPASSILAAKEMINSAVNGANCQSDMFTPRELQVAEALRRGKANKIIAYEMNLCESTVKVHIRNIMKKLNATNRTEVAFKLK